MSEGAMRSCGCRAYFVRGYKDVSTRREMDTRKLRDRDASMGGGDRGNAPDADSLRGDTSGMGGMGSGTAGTGGYSDQDTGTGSGYSSGGSMAGAGAGMGGTDSGNAGD